MNDHLSTTDIVDFSNDRQKNLAIEKIKHLKICAECQKKLSSQLSVHSQILNIEPLKSPKTITQGVMQTLGQLRPIFKPKNKTDWTFLISIITLFLLASWVLFTGDYNMLLGSANFDFLENYLPEMHKPEIIYLFQDTDLPDISHYLGGNLFYGFAGLLSVIFYYFLDNKLQNLFKMK